jgi:hypothetical protein
MCWRFDKDGFDELILGLHPSAIQKAQTRENGMNDGLLCCPSSASYTGGSYLNPGMEQMYKLT